MSDCFVDFYSEQASTGFQRNESNRQTRGRDVAEYIRRCVKDEVKPKLFELTANARVGSLGANRKTAPAGHTNLLMIRGSWGSCLYPPARSRTGFPSQMEEPGRSDWKSP